MIDVNNLTMTYPSGKGVFDINFSIKNGEIAGYLGPNGSGKTTTIRALLGFMTPQKGNASIKGFDCRKESVEIQKILGYIPGEIAFPEGMTGNEFLKFMNEMRGTKNSHLQIELLDMFDLSPKQKIRKFSKGMKQKLGIITAFMHDPEILILDEPSSGLDPLMQNRFVNLILSEKNKGKTILMSSHIFEEVEKTCDNVLIIKEGRIINESDIWSLKSSQRKGYIIETDESIELIEIFKNQNFEIGEILDGTIEVFVPGNKVDNFIKSCSKFNILDINVKSQNLDEIFMRFYSAEDN